MNTLGERIDWAMKEKELSRKQLANILGISTMAVGDLINNKTQKPRNLLEIAEVLGVDANWLRTGEGSTNLVALIPENEIDDDGAISFDVLDVDASAGFGSSSDVVEVVSHIKFNTDQYYELFRGMNPDPIKIVSVKGDSMSPTFENFDLLFVDTSITYYDGDGIYIFTFDDHTFVKRIQKVGRTFNAISDNKHYGTWEIDGECTIHGKVKVHQSQKLNFLA